MRIAIQVLFLFWVFLIILLPIVFVYFNKTPKKPDTPPDYKDPEERFKDWFPE